MMTRHTDQLIHLKQSFKNGIVLWFLALTRLKDPLRGSIINSKEMGEVGQKSGHFKRGDKHPDMGQKSGHFK